MKHLSYFLLLAMLTLSVGVQAQVETVFLPDSSVQTRIQRLKDASSSKRIQRLPSVDIESILKKDASLKDNSGPFHYGEAIDVNYSLGNGEWNEIDGGRMWSMTIESKGAKSLNFVFDNFYLPEGASLEIVGNEVIYGPVRKKDIASNGSFMSDLISGEQATLFLFEPTGCRGQSRLTISRVIHGYKDISINGTQRSLGSSSSCNVDVACYPEYEQERKAVAMIYTNLGNTFTGSLIMTTDRSFKSYILTAFHCLDSDDNGVLSESEKNAAQYLNFRFNYMRAECNGNAIFQYRTYSGATFRAAWKDTDFALLEINHELKNDPMLNWLGWDRSTDAPSSTASLHHPDGDVMKISLDFQSATSTGLSTNAPLNYWHVYFDEGISQPGSSGGSLLNVEKRVIGQLYGGDDSSMDTCQWINKYFGKFNLSWAGGGTSDTRLSNWLDPTGTNQLTTDTETPFSIVGSTIPCGSSIYYVDNLPEDNSYSVYWTWKESSTIPISMNTPISNQCTITNNNKAYIKNKLVAMIARNYVVVRTLEKDINTGINFTGTYEQAGYTGLFYVPAVSPRPFKSGSQFFVCKGTWITLKSSDFIGANITYTGTAPDYWIHADSIIRIKYNCLTPLNSVSAITLPPPALTITGTHPDNCETFKFGIGFLIINDPFPFTLRATPSHQNYCFELIPSEEVSQDAEKIASVPPTDWNLTIVHSLTGDVMFDAKVRGTKQSVNTAGWDTGVYVVRAVIDNNTITQKCFIAQ